MHVSFELYDQEFEFTYGDSDYIWKGSFSVESTDYNGTYETPPYGTTKIRITHTDEFLKQDEDGEYREVKPDSGLWYYLIETIKELL